MAVTFDVAGQHFE